MSLHWSTIQAILQGQPIPPVPAADILISHLCTDSRAVAADGYSLFVALRTPQRDGHTYLMHAYAQGIRHFVVATDAGAQLPPDAHVVPVPHTLTALHQLAIAVRQLFAGPVIGITGSNGKTIVKEWLHQVLSPDYSICRSPRSYNSQVGVPLSVWQLQPQHGLALFEAGISTMGEMEPLQRIIQPTWGIFVTLGAAHDEGFPSRARKLLEKWKLFEGCSKVFCRIDDAMVHAQATTSGVLLVSWGFAPEAQYRLLHMDLQGHTTVVTLLHKQVELKFVIPFTDEASVENALHVAIVGLEMQVALDTLQQRLLTLHALTMRLEWVKGLHHSLLLNDSYSYDLTSLQIALHHLRQQAGHQPMMAILSDLPAQDTAQAYEEVAGLLVQHHIRVLAGIGPNMLTYSHLFAARGIAVHPFASTHDFLLRFHRQLLAHTTVLIKGGRAFGFEKIVQQLQQLQHQTVLELHLTALAHNLNVYRSRLQASTGIMVMLKAFGYGSTDAELGRWLQHRGVQYLAVAYADEGVALRQGGVHLPIMVMNPDPDSFAQMVAHRLEPELYSFEVLQAFEEFATAHGLTAYPVHLKLDTGMHRLGFVPEQLAALTEKMTTAQALRVMTVFTHLVAAEAPEQDAFTQAQASAFEACTQALAQALPYPFLRHAANTAAIARHPHLHYDMVRLGIGLFGVANAADSNLNLQPVSRLYTTVAQVKQVAAGQSVGYGRKALLQRPSTIATVRIGYADGYRRQLGNGVGFMYLNGHQAPVLGNVCMDMTMLDVTDLPPVQPGDRVEVFGEHISVNDLARLCHTIPYEIMTGISRRVKRVLVEE